MKNIVKLIKYTTFISPNSFNVQIKYKKCIYPNSYCKFIFYMSDFIKRLKSVRKLLGLTQEQMGEICGIKKSGYSMIENGKSQLTTRNMELLIKALDINREWLIEGVGDMFTSRKARILQENPENLPDYMFIPVFDMCAVSVTGDSSKSEVLRFLPFCNTSSSDIAICLSDSSMKPMFRANTVLLISKIDFFNPLYDGGKPFFIVLKDGRRFVRVVDFNHANKDVIICKAQNEDYDDTDIELKYIAMIYKIKSAYLDTIY